jgi:hypothetical protein
LFPASGLAAAGNKQARLDTATQSPEPIWSAVASGARHRFRRRRTGRNPDSESGRSALSAHSKWLDCQHAPGIGLKDGFVLTLGKIRAKLAFVMDEHSRKWRLGMMVLLWAVVLLQGGCLSERAQSDLAWQKYNPNYQSPTPVNPKEWDWSRGSDW